MYDRHLDGFIRVVECQSFSKAAEDFFISPNALIKQMNILERDVGVQLLTRTNRGVQLTAAGEYFYSHAKKTVEQSRAVLDETRRIGQENAQSIIRLATSQLRPNTRIAEWWRQIEKDHASLKLSLVPIPDDIRAWPKFFQKLGTTIDVAAAIKPSPEWDWYGKCSIRDIYQSPRVCMVPIGHKLCGRTSLRLPDLRDEEVRLVRFGATLPSDELHLIIQNEYPEIKVAEYDPYDIESFNKIASERALAIISEEWQGFHPFFEYIPLETENQVTVSLLYPLDPTAAVLEFVDAIAAQANQ